MAITDLLPPELPTPQDARRLREAMGLTRTEFANWVGVSESSIVSWEAGARNPRGLHRKAYAQALIEIEEFLAKESS